MTETVTVAYAADFTPEADARITNLAEQLGLSYHETVMKLIEDGLQENTIAQRIVDMLVFHRDARLEMFDKMVKAHDSSAEDWLHDKYLIDCMLDNVQVIINGA